MDNKLKQPKGLYILFFTELCDRLTYYGIQSILVLYLTKYLHLSDINAYSIYGIYSTLAFSLPTLGGYLGDKFIGYINAVAYGILLIIIANIFIVIPKIHYFYIGLAVFICGIGFFKANNTSLLGKLYSEQDIRKEGGFTIFYMGMNVGAILGPIIYGVISIQWGWKAAFFTGAISSIACFIIFILGMKFYFNKSVSNVSIKYSYKIILSSVLVVLTISLLLKYSFLFAYLLLVIGLVTLIALYKIYKQYDYLQQNKILLIIILNFFSVFYFACSLQVSSSLILFIDRYIDTTVLGFHIPPAAFASLSAFFIIISAPLFAPLWTHLGKMHHAPTLITRIVLGLFLAVVSFLIFSLSTQLTFYHGINLPLICIVLGNFVLGAGELCIAPPLLAAVTYLIPKKLQATFMGFWYLSIAFAAYLSSLLAKLSAISTAAGLEGDLSYYHAFNRTALIAFIAGMSILIFFQPLQRLKSAIEPT